MTRKLLAVSLTVLWLAACSTTPEDTADSSFEGGGAGAGGIGSPTELGGGVGGSGLGGDDLFGSAAPGTRADFEINVGDRVFFGFDSSVLDDEARATLDRQASWLQQHRNVNVTVEGHTDERGTREYNLALGERRASAARNYLVALGVEPYRMTTISFGEERPVDPGRDEAAFRQNRRAVTVVDLTN